MLLHGNDTNVSAAWRSFCGAGASLSQSQGPQRMDLRTTKRVGELYRAVSEIANATSPDLTLRQLLVFLSVGSRTSPLNQQQLSDEHDLLKSTISKIVGNLAGMTGDVRREEGMGMLSVNLDPSDLRNRQITLSKQGEKVLSRAVAAFD